MTNQALYDVDFDARANEQASLPRAGRLAEANPRHIAEEIESMGGTEKRALSSRLNIEPLRLLKGRVQPSSCAVSLGSSIEKARDNPNLTSKLRAGYGRAGGQAAVETGVAQSFVPSDCPWTFEPMMDPGFWPGSA